VIGMNDSLMIFARKLQRLHCHIFPLNV